MIRLLNVTALWLFLGSLQVAHSAVGCSLANPDQDIPRFFPEMRSYRVHFLSFQRQAPEQLKALEIGLQSPLDSVFETLDVPYTLYVVEGRTERLGYVFGANNRGAHSSIQLIAALDAQGTLKDLYLQRIRSPEAESFRSSGFLDALTQAGLEEAPTWFSCYRDGHCEDMPVLDPSEGRAKADYQAILRGMAKLKLLKDLLLQPTHPPNPRTPQALAEWIGNYRGTKLVSARSLPLSPKSSPQQNFAEDDWVYVWGLGERALVWPVQALTKRPLLEFQIGEQSLLLASASLGTNPVLLFPNSPSAFRSTKDVLFEEQVHMDLETGSQWSLSLGQAIYGPAMGTQIGRGLGGLRMSWADAKASGLKLMTLHGPVGERTASPKGELLVLKTGSAHPAWRLSQLPEEGLLFQEGLLLARIRGDAIAWRTQDRQQTEHEFARAGRFHITDKATSTKWSLISGRAVDGPLEGRQLQGLVHLRLSESAWKSLFPGQSLAGTTSR